jgi:hypothetical protein
MYQLVHQRHVAAVNGVGALAQSLPCLRLGPNQPTAERGTVLKFVLDVMELLDDPSVDGKQVADYLDSIAGPGGAAVDVTEVSGPRGRTDFVMVRIPGSRGRASAGRARTLGVVGRLGGVGARPSVTGLVSDADGALAVLAAAAKLLSMRRRGDVLDGDVVIATHICPDAPTEPHEPVPFMGTPVDMATMNRYEVTADMEAVISVDTTKGNRVVNHRGLAISPTVKEGYVLRVSDQLGDLVEVVTGAPLVTLAVTTQDITPYGNGIYHINSIMQPATSTSAPVAGLAITSAIAVPGCATGANHEMDISSAARVVVEVAKAFGPGHLSFYDEEEFASLLSRYGSLAHLQTLGAQPEHENSQQRKKDESKRHSPSTSDAAQGLPRGAPLQEYTELHTGKVKT